MMSDLHERAHCPVERRGLVGNASLAERHLEDALAKLRSYQIVQRYIDASVGKPQQGVGRVNR